MILRVGMNWVKSWLGIVRIATHCTTAWKWLLIARLEGEMVTWSVEASMRVMILRFVTIWFFFIILLKLRISIVKDLLIAA